MQKSIEMSDFPCFVFLSFLLHIEPKMKCYLMPQVLPEFSFFFNHSISIVEIERSATVS